MRLPDFRARVQAFDGHSFETDTQKKPFTLQVKPAGLEFGVSSGNSRRERWQYVEQVLDLYNTKPSFRPGDYTFSRNASYVLRVLRAVLESE
jgi:hypothetical protein